MSHLKYRPDLPHPPEWVIAQAEKEWRERDILLGPAQLTKDIVKNLPSEDDGIKFRNPDPEIDLGDCAEFSLIKAGEEIQQWSKEWVDPECKIGIVFIKNGIYVAPHRDFHRVRAINYWISVGGEHVTTCWWRETLPRSSSLSKDMLRFFSRQYPYSKLTKIEEHCIENNVWHEIDVSEIHSVENLDINQSRWGLSISKFDP